MIMLLRLAIMVVSFWVEYKLLLTIDSRFEERQEKRILQIILMGMLLMAFCQSEEIVKDVLGCFFWASIAMAAYSDYLFHEIYNFVYIPAIAGSIFRIVFMEISVIVVIELIIFCIVQFFLFSRFYGLSDCIAFSTCALYMTADNAGLKKYLYLMSITFILLAIVQLVKKNINRKGNLKRPVGLIPYIAVSMMIMQLNFCILIQY